MVIAEQIYKNGNTSKNTNMEEADHASHGRNNKGGESTSPTNPDKGCTSNRKKTMQDIQ